MSLELNGDQQNSEGLSGGHCGSVRVAGYHYSSVGIIGGGSLGFD